MSDSVQVPEGWEVVKLGKYIKLQGGNAFKSSDFAESGIPVIRISNIKPDGLIDISDCVYHSESDSFTAFLVQENDILIAMSGATTGKTGKYSDQKPAYLNQRVGRFLPKNKNVSTEFIYQVVKSEKFSQKLLIDAIGGAQPNISGSQIESNQHTFPPLPEQKKIASILTSVDDVIEKTEAQIRKLQDLKKGMMTELLTKGINHTEFKDSPVGRIPVKWNMYSLSSLTKRITVGLACSVTEHYKEEGVAIIRNLNIKNGYFDDSRILYLDPVFCAENISKAVRGHDVLTVRTGANLGLTCLVPIAFDGAQSFTTLITTTNKELLHPNYLVHHMNSCLGVAEISKLQAGGGKNNLNAGELVNYKIALPSLEEQKKISQAISSVVGKLNSTTLKLSHTKSLKKALMNDLLTGKVRVSTTN